jgi:hypothetical protein
MFNWLTAVGRIPGAPVAGVTRFIVFWKVHSDFCFAADEAKADGKMSQVGRSREIKWGLSTLEEPAVSARAGQVHTE